jgi:hypothetical protein
MTGLGCVISFGAGLWRGVGSGYVRFIRAPGLILATRFVDRACGIDGLDLRPGGLSHLVVFINLNSFGGGRRPYPVVRLHRVLVGPFVS